MKVLDKYVLKEMVTPFLISLFAFVVMFIGQVIYENMGWMMEVVPSFWQILHLVGFKVPAVLKASVPCGILFAAAISVNRLAYDSEITAVRMAGVPVRRIIAPIFAIGILASIFTFWVSESAEPWAEREFNKTRQRLQQQQSIPNIPENTFFEVEGFYFYVYRTEKLEANEFKLHKVMIYERPLPEEFPRLITAELAENKGNLWTLHDGVLHDLGRDGAVRAEARFDEMELNLTKMPENIWEGQKTPEEMGFRELGRQISMYQGSGREASRMRVFWHFKLSTPLACLIYVLCAVPLSLRFSKSGNYSGIFLSVVIYFLYFNNVVYARFLGLGGVIPPFLAAWSQIFIFGAVGLFLMWREE